ncbi:MAG: hypothetical protein GF307_08095 [candidate division Zixibacteria bacterium]|nr:hypothetical protein [candidate division Zixibacteria bacterium]
MDDSGLDKSNIKKELTPERFRGLLKASIIALAADSFLIALKALLAWMTNSAVLSADAWHSAGDFAVTFTVMVSIIVKHTVRDKAWGRNAEGIVALFISLILMLGSLNIITGVFSRETVNFALKRDLPLIGAIIGISLACAIAFGMYRFKRRIAEEYGSIAFSAESFHTYSDFFTSIGVLLTLILGYFGIHVERIMTFIVGLIVLRIGINLLLRSIRYFRLSDVISIEMTKKYPSVLKEKLSEYFAPAGKALSYVKKLEEKAGAVIERLLLEKRNAVIKYHLIFILLLYAGTGFYSVLPYRTGIELVFGKVTDLTEPGLHYIIPKPFGDNVLVDTGVIARVESGYRTVWDYEGKEPEAYLWEYIHQQGRYLKVPDEAITITGDENLVDANLICYYRITDPVEYAFSNDNSHEMLRSLFCHEVHKVMGKHHLDSILTTHRGAIQDELALRMKQISKEIELGVEILNVYLQETHPPLDVVPNYRSVASARERKSEIIHNANSYANDLLPRSRGRSKSKVLDARGFSLERKTLAQGQAENFKLKYRNFGSYPGIHRERMRWDAIEDAFKDKKVYILPDEARRRVFTAKTNMGAKE